MHDPNPCIAGESDMDSGVASLLVGRRQGCGCYDGLSGRLLFPSSKKLYYFFYSIDIKIGIYDLNKCK